MTKLYTVYGKNKGILSKLGQTTAESAKEAIQAIFIQLVAKKTEEQGHPARYRQKENKHIIYGTNSVTVYKSVYCSYIKIDERMLVLNKLKNRTEAYNG